MRYYINVLCFQLCLEEYNYEIEKVINAVLEDKLPPSLIDLDRTMKRYWTNRQLMFFVLFMRKIKC